MSIGAGITMTVFGLIFLLNVIEFDVAGINENALGLLLTLGGIAIILVSLRGVHGWAIGRGTTTTRVVEQAPQPQRVVEQPRTERVVERRIVERDVQDPNVL
jgi:hypothetical protein